MDFELIPDSKGFFLDVKYPHEDHIRYTISIVDWDCTCTGHTIEMARAKKAGRKPKNCKHLDEVTFRLRRAGIKLGRFVIKEALP